MIRQVELVEKVKSYDPFANEDLLNKAYVFSMKAHGSQKRASGDPYFLHPLEVAGILTDLRLDWQSIVTALLHDTVEDTIATLSQIEHMFGKDIAALVDGVTKLTKLEQQSAEKTQAENFRKLLLAMSKDIRVLLVKLADRLHNMRTLHFIRSDEKKRRIAKETMEIFSPLAGRIGLQDMKTELEDIAFGFLHPEARDSIETRLHFLRDEGEESIAAIIATLQATLTNEGIVAEICGRQKSAYSIWKKMQEKNIPFEQLLDIIAFRVVVPTLSDCYHTLGVIHSTFALVPGRFKDYISIPKPNGYKSLHTTVLIPPLQRIEIQIRTHDMHRECELGVAAHWVYKEDGAPPMTNDLERYGWLRALLDILEQASDPREFLEHSKLEMFSDQVFCFSPKGDLVTLPHGATSVDFAYAVHSDVGNRCTGAKINGRLMPLKTVLQNGDQVEIMVSPHHEPSPAWERFVTTGKAKAHIRRFVKHKEREQYANLGHALIVKSAKKYGLAFEEAHLEASLSSFKVSTLEDAYVLIGKGILTAQDALARLYPDTFHPHKIVTLETLSETPQAPKPASKASLTLVIEGLMPGMAIHYARCCHPLPGDTIAGIVTTGKGVSIHTSQCSTLDRFAHDPNRILDIAWGPGAASHSTYIGRLRATIANEPGSLGALTTLIGKQGSNISNVKISNRSHDFFDLHLDVDVSSRDQLDTLIGNLRANKFINSVVRV